MEACAKAMLGSVVPTVLPGTNPNEMVCPWEKQTAPKKAVQFDESDSDEEEEENILQNRFVIDTNLLSDYRKRRNTIQVNT